MTEPYLKENIFQLKGKLQNWQRDFSGQNLGYLSTIITSTKITIIFV